MIAVVLNPASGQTKRERLREEIDDLCRRAGLDARIREVPEAGAIGAITRDVLASRPEAVVAAGGDGTVSSVAAVLAGGPTPAGILPLGTLNHFAKDLGIPLDRAKAVEVIAAGHVRAVDVGRVNGRVFINNSSIGVYPSIVEIRERLRHNGHRKWIAFVLATLEVLRRADEVSIRLEADRTNIIARTPFVFVGNNEYLVEGIKLGARTRLDRRRLYAYFAPPVRTRYLPRLLARSLFGVAHHEHVLVSVSATELWIDTPAAHVSVACDGELVTLAVPLHYRSWPGALKVLAPSA